MIEVKTDPTPSEVRVFGLLWLLFFVALAAVAWWKPEGLIGAAMFLGAAWLVSLLFNPANKRAQLLGVLLPGALGALGWSSRGGWPVERVLGVTCAVAVLGAIAIWVLPALGRKLYVGWMWAAMPLGWTISHLVLGAVFYLVVTPIALIMRLSGRDPMRRRFDREARSYWIERDARVKPDRYFRQF